MKKILIIAIALFSFSASAQDLDLNYERYLIAGETQAPMIIKDYFNPAMIGLMNTASSGWYSTAETHKRFGFDITVNLMGAVIPDDDLNFDISKYDEILVDGKVPTSPTQVATIMGERGDTQNISSSIYSPVNNVVSPNGVGISPLFTPSAMLQVGLGIGWGTEIKARFMPKLGDKGFEAGLWGIAIQHNVDQYIPVVKKLPLKISVLAGYTKMDGTWTFNEDDNDWKGSGQYTDFNVQNYTFQLLASTNIPIINVYGGVGYSKSTAYYDMKGEYIIDDHNGHVTTMNDPARSDWDESGMSATVGARLSLAFFKIYADWTFKQYNTANIGISLSFR